MRFFAHHRYYYRTLVEEPYSPDHQAFLEEGGITHHRILVHPNKDPAVKTPDAVVIRILQILVTRSNQPVLVHCNKGKVSFSYTMSPCLCS